MPYVKIIPKEQMRTTEWTGGTTTELFIWPEGASYAERRFSARISTATVDIEESVFTALPGVKRFLTPLCPGFELNVNGEKTALPYGSVLEFSGGDDVACRGSGRDLNLMLKGVSGAMSIETGVFRVPENALAFVFAPSETAIHFCSDCASCTSSLLMRHDFAEIGAGEYSASAPLVLFVIETDPHC